MRIVSVDGTLSLNSLFLPVAIGYAIGFGVLVIPMMFILIPIILYSPSIQDQNGELITGAGPILAEIAPMFLAILAILPLQGVLFAGIIVLGLRIHRMRWPIRVVPEKNLEQK
jgi:hypothetical protein